MLVYRTYQDIIKILKKFDPNFNEAKVKKAFDFAIKHHGCNNNRPIKITKTITSIYLDTNSVIAALLFFSLTETKLKSTKVKHDFDQEISKICDALDKLFQIHDTYHNIYHHSTAQETFKLLLSLTPEVKIRILLIRFAYLLHEIIFSPETSNMKYYLISNEISKIYVPLFNEIKIERIITALQDVCLRILQPQLKELVVTFLKEHYPNQESLITTTINAFHDILSDVNIAYTISGRVKSCYSLIKKAIQRSSNVKRLFDIIGDIIGIRVIVEEDNECYKILESIYYNYQHIPELYKDFIKFPKKNNYQSLHTIIVDKNCRKMELQIRSKRMHNVAQFGSASHSRYKMSSINTNDTLDTAYSILNKYITDILNPFTITLTKILRRNVRITNEQVNLTSKLIGLMKQNIEISQLQYGFPSHGNSTYHLTEAIRVNTIEINQQSRQLNNIDRTNIDRIYTANADIAKTPLIQLQSQSGFPYDFSYYITELIIIDSTQLKQQSQQLVDIDNDNIYDNHMVNIEIINNNKLDNTLNYTTTTVEKQKDHKANFYDQTIYNSDKDDSELQTTDIHSNHNVSKNEKEDTLNNSNDSGYDSVVFVEESEEFKEQQSIPKLFLTVKDMLDNSVLHMSEAEQKQLQEQFSIKFLLLVYEEDYEIAEKLLIAMSTHGLAVLNIIGRDTQKIINATKTLLNIALLKQTKDSKQEDDYNILLGGEQQYSKQDYEFQQLWTSFVEKKKYMVIRYVYNACMSVEFTPIINIKEEISEWQLTTIKQYEIEEQLKLQCYVANLCYAILIEDTEIINKFYNTNELSLHLQDTGRNYWSLVRNKDGLLFNKGKEITKLLYRGYLDKKKSEYNELYLALDIYDDLEICKRNIEERANYDLLRTLMEKQDYVSIREYVEEGMEINSRSHDRLYGPIIDISNNTTVFFDAVSNNNIEAVQQLLNFKDAIGNYLVNINHQNSNCISVLLSAIMNKNIEIVKILIALKDISGELLVDVNSEDEDGNTPLSFAVRNGFTEIVKMLLELKDSTGNLLVNVNHEDEVGNTALLIAARYESIEIVKILLELKDCNGISLVDINHKNRANETVMDYFQDDDQMKQLLMGHGVKEISKRHEDITKNTQSTHTKYVKTKVSAILDQLREEFKKQNTKDNIKNNLEEIKQYIYLLQTEQCKREESITFNGDKVTIGVRSSKDSIETCSQEINTIEALKNVRTLIDSFYDDLDFEEALSLAWLKIIKNEQMRKNEGLGLYELKSDLIKNLAQSAFEYTKDNKIVFNPACKGGTIHAIIATVQHFEPIDPSSLTSDLKDILDKEDKQLIDDAQRELKEKKEKKPAIQKLREKCTQQLLQKHEQDSTLSDADLQQFTEIFNSSIEDYLYDNSFLLNDEKKKLIEVEAMGEHYQTNRSTYHE